jgi:hypothetical protein
VSVTDRRPGRGAPEPEEHRRRTGVTAIVPALDEEAAIGAVVEALRRVIADEVIVVDGGSRDATAQRARAAGARVVVETRRGYGRACLTGAAHAQDAEVLLFCDGDGSDVIEQAPRLTQPIQRGHADLVIGSRIRGRRQPGSMRIHQLAGNILVAWLIRVRHHAPVSDIGPFRAIRANLLPTLELREVTYGFPTEMIARTALRGYRIAEVPVDYRARDGGQSKVSSSLRGSLLAGYHMLRVAWSPEKTRSEGGTPT